jgi:hypothetical protein
MKFTLLKAAAVASVLVFGSAQADSIQVDLNGDSVLTPVFNELSVDYNSHTIVNVVTGAVHTYAGAALITNNILGLGDVYSDFNDMTLMGGINTFTSTPNIMSLIIEGGFGTGSYLSFGVDLMGTFGPGGISYTSGTLDLWQGYYDGSAPEQIMSSTFTSGGLTAGNQNVLSISGAADILKDDVMFFDINGTPVSFEDYLAANPLSDIRLTIDQNVTGGAAGVAAAVGGSAADGFIARVGDEVYVSANHNASLTFAVPEPTSLAILGLGLLGFAGTRRRKA